MPPRGEWVASALEHEVVPSTDDMAAWVARVVTRHADERHKPHESR